MEKMIVAGWDPGRLNNKLYLNNKKIINMNAICSGYERRVLEDEEGDYKNYLDVEVYKGDECLGRYFVGGMAYKHNRGDIRWSANGIPKFQNTEDSNDEVIKLMTHLALSQYDANQPVKKVYFRLGTGAPTEEYFEQSQLLDMFKETLKHPYKVIFKHKLFNGAQIEVAVPEVYFKPEGTASVISMSYDDNLKRKDELKNILDKGYKVIGINIGSSTSDVAMMNSNMEFEPIGFFGIDVGTSNALNEIRTILYRDYGYDVNKLKLDFLIRNYNMVRYKGKLINLEEIKRQPFRNLISLLKTKFFDQIEMRGIDLGEAGAFMVSGGAVILIEDKLNNFIPGVPTMVSLDPLFEDARGYFLEAKMNDLLSLKSQDEVFANNGNKNEIYEE